MSIVFSIIGVLAVCCYSLALHIIDRKKTPWYGAGQVVTSICAGAFYVLVILLFIVVLGLDTDYLIMELTK